MVRLALRNGARRLIILQDRNHIILLLADYQHCSTLTENKLMIVTYTVYFSVLFVVPSLFHCVPKTNKTASVHTLLEKGDPSSQKEPRMNIPNITVCLEMHEM